MLKQLNGRQADSSSRWCSVSNLLRVLVYVRVIGCRDYVVQRTEKGTITTADVGREEIWDSGERQSETSNKTRGEMILSSTAKHVRMVFQEETPEKRMERIEREKLNRSQRKQVIFEPDYGNRHYEFFRMKRRNKLQRGKKGRDWEKRSSGNFLQLLKLEEEEKNIKHFQ